MTTACVQCGAQRLKPFTKRDFVVEHGSIRQTVAGLAGEECAECGEIYFDDRSVALYADAGDALVRAERKRAGDELRRIRLKLNLTQRGAVDITGGGHNAFSRYERGEVVPLLAVTNLMRLLDRHPELLAEIAAPPADNVVSLEKKASPQNRAPVQVVRSAEDRALAANTASAAHDFRDGGATVLYTIDDPGSQKAARIEVRRRAGRMFARWLAGEKLEVRTNRTPERFAVLPTDQQWTQFDAGGDIVDNGVLRESFRFVIDKS